MSDLAGDLGERALLLIFACALVAAFAASPSYADPFFGESTVGPAEHPVTGESSNNSALRFQSHNRLTSDPVKISAGRGYYASHPIFSGSGISNSISIGDSRTATSMYHDVTFAREITGQREIIAREKSFRHGDIASGSSTSISMMINENVTEGRIHMGALQGSGAAGTDPFKELLKNPDLELEEDYIGTYHIDKKMAFSSSSSWDRRNDSWLGCCPERYFPLHPDNRFPAISGGIFDYNAGGYAS